MTEELNKPNFHGKWEHIRSENFEDFMRENGKIVCSPCVGSPEMNASTQTMNDVHHVVGRPCHMWHCLIVRVVIAIVQYNNSLTGRVQYI